MPESPEVTAEAERPDYTFETFVASGSSVAVVAACVAVADKGPANPLFLFGLVGSGKTHLLHATAGSLKARRPHGSIRRLRAREYVAELLTAVRANESERFRETFSMLDALLLDDLHVTGAMPATDEEIFRCLAEMISAGVQLVITCTQQSRETVQQHVLARSFKQAAIFDLAYPDLTARTEILRRLTASRGLMASPAWNAATAAQCDGSPRQLQSAIARYEAELALTSA
jgi:chromosomal replication initiator protein